MAAALELDTKSAIALGVGALLLAYFILGVDRRKDLPPTPPGVPLLGNLPDIIKASKKGIMHILFQEYAQKYGDVVRIRAGPNEEYFLNSARAVKEIMDRGTAQTSERPRWIFSNELVCNKRNVLFLGASDPRWKNQRKVITNQMTSPQMADGALPLNYFETARFMYRVATDPQAGTQDQKIWKKLKRYQYSLFSMQTFGFPIEEDDDPVIDYIFNTGETQIKGTLPGARIVENFPWLQGLPMALKPWEKEGRARHSEDLEWSRQRMQRCKDAIQNGTALPSSALARMLQDPKLAGLEDEDEAAYLSLMLIIGAADTSMMTTWSFLEAMMSFPEVQKKAQAEIDAALPDRLPRWEDLESLPYMRCIMKEVWRWRPPVALGHPHITTRDIPYDSMVIPKGAYLHINAWAIQHDPARHEDPERFWPERYADDHTTSQQSLNLPDFDKRDHFVFGAGRRVCPGYHVAERSFAIAFMRILWAFNVTPKAGVKVPLALDSFDGFMPGTRGEGMPVNLTVRDASKKKILEAEYHAECAEFEHVLQLGTL